MGFEIIWNKPPKQIIRGKLHGTVGMLWLGTEFAKLMDQYVPADQGDLSRNIKITAGNGKVAIHYKSPYAHYQYAGIYFEDPKNAGGSSGKGFFRSRRAKKPTSRKLKYSNARHPEAQAKWDQPARKAQLPELLKEYQAYIKG